MILYTKKRPLRKLLEFVTLAVRILAQREHLFWRNVNAISGFA